MKLLQESIKELAKQPSGTHFINLYSVCQLMSDPTHTEEGWGRGI